MAASFRTHEATDPNRSIGLFARARADRSVLPLALQGRDGAGGRTRTGMGIRPTDFRTTSAFAAARRRSWSGLSLHRGRLALGAARL